METEKKKSAFPQWNKQGVINVLWTIIKTVNYKINSFGRKLENQEAAKYFFTPYNLFFKLMKNLLISCMAVFLFHTPFSI